MNHNARWKTIWFCAVCISISNCGEKRVSYTLHPSKDVVQNRELTLDIAPLTFSIDSLAEYSIRRSRYQIGVDVMKGKEQVISALAVYFSEDEFARANTVDSIKPFRSLAIRQAEKGVQGLGEPDGCRTDNHVDSLSEFTNSSGLKGFFVRGIAKEYCAGKFQGSYSYGAYFVIVSDGDNHILLQIPDDIDVFRHPELCRMFVDHVRPIK
jgi:hypothetical protein